MRHFSFRPALTMRGRQFKGLRGWAGKPLHPPLTDIPVGAYMLAAAFDVISAVGNEQEWARDFYRVLHADRRRRRLRPRRADRLLGLVPIDPARHPGPPDGERPRGDDGDCHAPHRRWHRRTRPRAVGRTVDYRPRAGVDTGSRPLHGGRWQHRRVDCLRLRLQRPDRGRLSGTTPLGVHRHARLHGASLSAIGAFSRATIGYFDRNAKTYKHIPVEEQVEVLSLTGDIALADNTPKLHAHVVLGRQDGSTCGGHLLEGVVWPTLEVVLTQVPQHPRRRTDPATGLPLIDLTAIDGTEHL